MSDGVKQTNLSVLENRQQQLLEKLSRLNGQYDLETRVEEKMRTEKIIAETQASLEVVGQELLVFKHQKQLTEASRLKGIGSPREALVILREIQGHDPANNMLIREISVLEKLSDLQDRAANLVKRLASRVPEIRPVFKDIVAALRLPMDTAEYQVLLEQTESLLDRELDAESYVMWWEAVSEDLQTHKVQSIDMARIAGRVQRGEMVLFLGAGVTSAYLGAGEQEGDLVGQLAQQIGYEPFNGSLSSIAEYYQLRPDFGHSELLKTVRSHLTQNGHETVLYSALAKVPAPLILISSVYDNRLEDAFREKGKAFVALTSIVRRSDDYDIGHVVVSYSDNSQPCRVYPEEELSGLRFREKGYSIIYKIRGNCNTPQGNEAEDDLLQQDALTLSESSYFSFARYADKIIPGYLARQLRNRGFLFVGYQPKEWEDRLLASALLERRNSQEPCYVIGGTAEPMEMAFWKSRSVEQYPVGIRELDRCLGEVLL